MLEVGALSYTSAAVAFAVLSLLLLTSWRGRLQGALLVTATGTTVVWAAAVALQRSGNYPVTSLVLGLELFRNLAWAAFLLRLLLGDGGWNGAESGIKWLARAFGALWLLLLVLILAPAVGGWVLPEMLHVDVPILGHVAASVLGLALVEQLYRNARPERRWGVKYLCLGIGGLFAYDFYLYSDALLFKRVDVNLWDARGAINALVVPLIAVAAARNPQWSLDVFVSRRILFHTVALLGAGVYLIAMAAGGYYLRLHGGDWGGLAQVTFLFGAAVVLLVMMASGHFRAHVKVFLNKHFFNYKYDYREEWLRLTDMLSTAESGPGIREKAIQAIADLVDSPGGVLWLNRANDQFDPIFSWNMPEVELASEATGDSLASFLAGRGWVVNVDEYARKPELYADLELPDWLACIKRAWLVVPLLNHGRLLGFILLAQPRASRTLNWEDVDLLKTAARQVASHLAQLEAAEALAQARQFEAFNRLSAFLVHDLKNVIAQLSLLHANAARHKHNPAFIDDAFGTVESAIKRMSKMLAQLRSGRVDKAVQHIDMNLLLQEVASARASGMPLPILELSQQRIIVNADRDRLLSVICHVVQNAQDATPADGSVRLRLQCDGSHAVIDVIDTGCGMDAQFIRDRLFRPFDSTKGGAGMGIGAFDAREFARELGGDVQVQSCPGEGTTFSIRLPLAAADGRRADVAGHSAAA